MYWNNYGKLDSLKNTNKSIAMKFRYDPMGNRIEKRLYHLDGSGSVIRQSARHYVRDAQGNPLAVYDLLGGDTIVLSEFNLYGTNRLGMLTTSDTLVCATCTTATAPSVYLSPVGNKRYELSNHLGNVMTIISDKPVPIDTTSDGLWDYFNASMVSATDYYPFGMGQPGRSFSNADYRFGFNTQEKVDVVSGSGNHYAAPYWEYDPRTGRRWNLDPAGYPYQSHYSVNNNNPILFSDPLGIYGAKREARQMRSEAKAAGYNVGNVYKSGDEYGFAGGKDGDWAHYFKQNYFGKGSAEVQDISNLWSDPLFENPFKRIAGTLSAERQITTFFLGTSDNKKYFEPSSGFSYMMKNSPGVRNALDNYLNDKDRTKTSYGFSPNTSSMKMFWETLPTSIEAHLDFLTNGNLARLSVGGYTAIITPTSDENIIRIHLVNDMSMGSLLLHSKWAYDNPPKTGPLSTVEMKIDLGLFDISSLRIK